MTTRTAIPSPQDPESVLSDLRALVLDARQTGGNEGGSTQGLRTREDIEAFVLHEAHLLTPGDEIMGLVLESHSTRLLDLLLTSENRTAWSSCLKDTIIWLCDRGHIPANMVDFHSAPVSHLLRLQELGLPLHLNPSDLYGRYILEPDPAFDQMLETISHRGIHPLVKAIEMSVTSLSDFSPGAGLRHLPILENLVTQNAPGAREALDPLMGLALRYFDWRTIALLIRMGIFPVDDRVKERPALWQLVNDARSNHGRLRLLASEPSILEMGARPQEGPFFGLFDADVGCCL